MVFGQDQKEEAPLLLGLSNHSEEGGDEGDLNLNITFLSSL
jgi:hypothetical protein